MCGVGVIAAARLIGELGCTPRIRSAAALAALAGIAPVAVSSGGRNGHRLNRGGNRRLNRTFHMIAVCQLRCEPLAQAYYAKKRAEGKTARSALRCLKRRLVDVVYRLMREQERVTVPDGRASDGFGRHCRECVASRRTSYHEGSISAMRWQMRLKASRSRTIRDR